MADSTRTLSSSRTIDHQVPPIIRGCVRVRALGRRCMPGAVAERRQGEQRHDGGEHQGADRGERAAVAGAARQGDIDELDAEADRHQAADRPRQLVGALGRERQHPPRRPARRQRRGREADHQQEDDHADDELRHQRVDRRRRRGRGQKLADQPDGEDRHQHQADAVDGGGEGAVALAGLDLMAAPEAAAQEAPQPPQGHGHDRPDGQRGEILVARTQRAQALAAPRRQRRRQGLDRRLELRPELAPHLGRQRRDVPVQQGVEHDLAAQLGQALRQLVGARDDHFALLELALADRRQLGQPGAIGLHRVGFRHRLAARLQLRAAPAASWCRPGRCGRWPRRRWPQPARRPPARAGRRSRPAAGWPVRSAWRCGRAGASRRRSAGRTAAAAATRSGRTPRRRRATAAPARRCEATPGEGKRASLFCLPDSPRRQV